MKKLRRILSAVLVISLLFSVCAVPAMAEEAPKKYAFYGDSMTYNFVFRNDYHDPLYTFSNQAADAMGYSFELNQISPEQRTEWGALPGGRYTDLYAFLSGYSGDDYFQKEFGGWSEAGVEGYGRIADEADVLSIQMGYSNTTMVLLQNFISLLDSGEVRYSVDLSQLFAGDELAKIMPFVAGIRDTVNALVPSSTRSAMAQFANSLSENQQKALKAVFGEEAINSANGTLDLISKLIDNLVYLLASHIIHFDRAVETLYERNPDLELYIMGMHNPVQFMKLSFRVGCQTFYIPIGDMLGAYFDMANTYMKVLSPNSTRYCFVDNVRHAHSYGEAMAESIDMSRDILFTVYNGCWTGHEDTGSEAYRKADERAYGVMTALRNGQTIDLNRIIDELPDDLDSLSLSTDVECLDRLVEVDEDGNLKATYMEQMMAVVYFFQALKGLFVHPDQAGHDVQAPLLIAAMQDPKIAPEAVSYHRTMQPLEEAIAELESCDSPKDFANWINSLPKKAFAQKLRLIQAAPEIGKLISDTSKKLAAKQREQLLQAAADLETYMRDTSEKISVWQKEQLIQAATLLGKYFKENSEKIAKELSDGLVRDAEPSAIEVAPAAEALPVMEEAPVIEELPVIEEAPVIEELPVIEEAPVIDELPVIEEAPVIDEQSVIEETPVIDELPVIEETPVIDELPVIEEAPMSSGYAFTLDAPWIVYSGRSLLKNPVISWLPVLGATSYKVYRCDTEDGEYVKLDTTLLTTFTDLKASRSSKFYYKVVACSVSNMVGDSAFSEAVYVK